jgi:cytidylate kinase
MCERILERDRIDSTRSDGPLVCPDDAIVIDTSELSIEGVIDEMERVVRDRLDDL